ncbi:LAQU0S04e09098g1_1 [Lachancea quebecensis]|uniref:LAQU0S04e09098g1_1 n=1 Tax=Lachancea quebecensis TaxID=1654605 RepID=A0A0P1KQ86_9SACH|nr:LAQU0S04e09098g1_1 [Lachancea quebecensis]
MTTELYPGDYFGGKPKNESVLSERSWLINEIIKPELPNIIDNVDKCLELLTSNDSFKMPISNGVPAEPNAAYVRGVLTRKGALITDFQVMIKFKQFNRGKHCLFKMDSGVSFPIEQIDTITQNLKTVSELLDSLQLCSDVETFTTDLSHVMELLSKSTSLLQYPPNNLLFPFNGNMLLKRMFKSSESPFESNHHVLNIDLVILNTEVCMDFRNLQKITTRPWSDYNPETDTTFTDKIRDELKFHRGKKLSEVLQDQGLHIEEPSLLRNMLPHKNTHNTTTLPEAQEILARCLTFEAGLVSECEKVSVSTSDPSLISITSKLNGLETCVSNYYSNITQI